MLVASPLLAQALETDAQNLLQIYQQAQASDPAWASAQSANKAAQEKLIQGKALTLPNVGFSANLNHAETDIGFNHVPTGAALFLRNGRQDFETYGYNVNVTHPLYRRQNSIQYEESKTQVAQADVQLTAAQQELALRVSQAYFDVLNAQDKIDLINAQKAAISKQLDQAKANFEVGTSTITDVNEAQARYDLLLAQEIAAINDLENKKHAVESLIGNMPERLLAARADLQATMITPHEMAQWVDIAVQNNLQLRVQQKNLELADQEIERAHAGHLPTVDAVGSYSDSRANGGVSAYGQDLQNFTIGLQLQVPIYQGGAINSKEREAVFNKQKALDDLELNRRKAELQTRQAWLDLSSSVAQVKAYEQALVSSQSQLDSTSLGYEVGVRTSVDVLNAQQQYFSAKRDLLQARYSYLLNTLKLKFVAGVLAEGDIAEVNGQLQ